MIESLSKFGYFLLKDFPGDLWRSNSLTPNLETQKLLNTKTPKPKAAKPPKPKTPKPFNPSESQNPARNITVRESDNPTKIDS